MGFHEANLRKDRPRSLRVIEKFGLWLRINFMCCKNLLKEWPRNSLQNVQGNIVRAVYFHKWFLFFPATVTTNSGRRLTSHNTGTNTDHVDFSTNGWPRKERQIPVMSLLEQSPVSVALVALEWGVFDSRFCPVILLSNSKQLWQFQQNRLRKFGHGSLTTALLQIQLNTPVNFTVRGSQQRPTHLFSRMSVLIN